MKTSGFRCETKFGLLVFWDTLLSNLSQLLSHHRARDQESKSEHIEVLVLRRDGLGIFKKHWSVHLDQNDNPHSKMMPMMISGMVQGGQGGGVE